VVGHAQVQQLVDNDEVLEAYVLIGEVSGEGDDTCG